MLNETFIYENSVDLFKVTASNPPPPHRGLFFSNSGMYTAYQELDRVGVFGMKNFYYDYNCFCLLCTTYHKH